MTGRPLPFCSIPRPAWAGPGRERERLEAELKRQAIAYALTVTENEDHLRRLTRALAAGGSALAVAGGDSTFLIMRRRDHDRRGRGPASGLIGIGSSNDIPREFGIETLERACAALKSGTAGPIDVGWSISASGGPTRYFLGQANVGLGPAVNAYVAGLGESGRRLARRQTLAGFLGIVARLPEGRSAVRLDDRRSRRSGVRRLQFGRLRQHPVSGPPEGSSRRMRGRTTGSSTPA